MRVWFQQSLDRIAIQLAAARMPQPDGRDLRVAEAARILTRPDFFPANAEPAKIQFDSSLRFHFPTPRPGAFAVNNNVPGRFYPAGPDWRQRPFVLLLHGWNDILNQRFFFPRHARRLNRLGLSAMTIQLPWHFNRRPRELGRWSNFLSADLGRTVESVQQALADIRAVINWATSEGCPVVGLWGISMGAWLAGLTVCHDARLGAAVLEVPVANMELTIKTVAFCETIRAAIQNHPFDLSPLNLTDNQPLIPPQKILLIASQNDLFVDKASVEELWQRWQHPEIWRLNHGHLSVLGSPTLARRITGWLAQKAA